MIALSVAAALLALSVSGGGLAPVCGVETIALRGKPQHVRVCGDRRGPPVVVASGDGGWIRLAPHVADVLSARGYFVIGFDSKAYLESFTGGRTSLTTADVAADFTALISSVSPPSAAPAVLVGVSEGAALAVVAAASDMAKPHVAGVIAMGLGEANELAWRWRDAIIYITKRIPDEPCFRTSDYIDKVAPLPLALIQSASDEYVTRAEADRLAARARVPKRTSIIDASDHAFSNKRSDLDATVIDDLAWIAQFAPRHVQGASSR